MKQQRMLKLCMALGLAMLCLCACGEEETLQAQIDQLKAQLESAQSQAADLQTRLDAAEESYAAAEEDWAAEREALNGEIDRMLPVYQYIDRDISDEMVEEAYEQHRDELFLSAWLGQGTDAIFGEYTGEAVVRYGEDSLGNGTITDDAYYWEGGDISPEKAAAELVEIMLKDVQGTTDKNYTLDKYRAGEQTLYSREDMISRCQEDIWNWVESSGEDISRDDLAEFIDGQFPQWTDGKGYMRSEELMYALDDDMWIFAPNFSIQFTGACNGINTDTDDLSSFQDEDGYVNGLGDGSESMYYCLLIRNGDVWRMQKCAALTELDEQMR